MRTTVKTFAIISIVIGAFALLNGEGDYYSLIGGLYFLVYSILVLVYIGEVDKKSK